MTLLLPFDCLQYIGDVGDTVVRYKLSCTCKELNQRMQKYKHVTVIANKLRSTSQFSLSYYEAKKFRGDTMQRTNELLREHAIPTNWNHINIVLNKEEPFPRDYTVNRCYTEEVTSPDYRFLRRLEMDGAHGCDTLSIMTADQEETYLKIDAYSLLDFEAYELFEKSRIIPLVEEDYVVNRYHLIIRVDRKARLKAKDWYGSQVPWNQMSEEEKQPWREKKLDYIQVCRVLSIERLIDSLTDNADETDFKLYWIPEKNELHVIFPLSAIRE